MSSSYRSIHFNALPEVSRVRLAKCLNGKALPMPIVSERAGRMWHWMIVMTMGIGYLWALLNESLAREFLWTGYLIFMGFGVLFCVAGGIGVIRAIQLRRSLPFPPGRYLFAREWIEATGPILQLTSLNELKSVQLEHRSRHGAYTGSRLTIRLPEKTMRLAIFGKETAEQALAELRTTRSAFAEAAGAQDLRTLEALDPLFEARVSNEWKSLRATATVLPRDAVAQARELSWSLARVGQVWLVGAIAAFALAPPIWHYNNLARDEEMFQALKKNGREESFSHYLSIGGRHSEEVKNDLMPKAAFTEAKESHSVERLRRVAKTYQGHPPAAEAEAEIRSIYRDSLQRALQQADPSAHEFLRRLFAWLEKHEEKVVDVCFGAPSSETLAEVDRRLSAEEGKANALPIELLAPSFRPSECRKREGRIVTVLWLGFKQVGAGESFLLSEAKPLLGSGAAFSKPTLAIHYAVKPLDGFYVNEAKTRAFARIKMEFSLMLSVPDAGAPMNLKFEVEPPEQFRSELRDAVVYDTMAREAFARLGELLSATFFKHEAK